MDALKAIVGSEARARVLTALFAERGRSFYQKELARATELPLIAVQRELKRLVTSGLVTVSTAAGRRVYSADPASAVYAEIAGLLRKLRGPQAALREALAIRRNVEVAFVFGSLASGSATAASDVDLMILGSESPRLVRTALARAERDLKRSINEHVMTSAEWTARLRKRDPFLTNVRSEPKLWVVGNDEALAALDYRRKAR
jgi:predicted nucleotidyltransferase